MTRPMAARRRRRAGFTLIEVLVSLGIMTVGAMAIMALQAQTIRANSFARQLTVATQIAQVWAERLKQDANMWTEQGQPTGGIPTVTTVLQRTTYLRLIESTGGVFFAPADSSGLVRVSPAFDFQGNDVPRNSIGTHYCAQIRLQWVYFGEAMRADVRVWFPKVNSGANMVTDSANCDPGPGDPARLEPGGTLFGSYHVVYLPSVIRVTPLIR